MKAKISSALRIKIATLTAALAAASCSTEKVDRRSRAITQKELENTPEPKSDGPNASNDKVVYSSESFSISELEANATMDLVDMMSEEEDLLGDTGLSLHNHAFNEDSDPVGLSLNDDDYSRNSNLSEYDMKTNGFSLAGDSNSPNFRSWYRSSIEPEKSQHFSVSCEQKQNTQPADPRIVMVRLQNNSNNSTSVIETIAFKISTCDKVKYDILNLEANKPYTATARIYRVKKDKVDPDSSLFTTELMLEGTTIPFGLGINSKPEFSYRRVVDNSSNHTIVTIKETGANETDPLKGGNVKISLLRADGTKDAKKVPNVKITLTLSTDSTKVVTLTTNSEGIATTKDLLAGIWNLSVQAFEAGNLNYKLLLDRIQINANQDFEKVLTVQPFVYGWFFQTAVPIKIKISTGDVIDATVNLKAGVNDRPDNKGSHSLAFQTFKNY